MEKIIHKLINEFTEGVDTYTHNNSTWLIFSETKQWVIELTENKTLWYNYNFFKSVFAYASLDCVQNQHLITKWVEDNIINKVSDIRFRDARDNKHQFEDTLENGVKETRLEVNITEGEVDDIIQDGVRHTKMAHMKTDWSVEDTIENGVKETQFNDNENKSWVEGVIKGGVKETLNTEYMLTSMIEDTIQNGVKETKSDDFNVSQFLCEEVIDKGVKETKYHMSKLRVDAYKTVDNGVKETNHVDVMKFFNNKMEDTLKNGVKETKQKKNSFLVLDTSGRELILESHLVVRDGVKSSNPRQYVGENIIDKIINKGITDTIECDWDVPTELIENVIDDGVKETYDDAYHHKGRIDGVINNGVKKIMAGNYTDPSTSLLYIRWEAQIEDVIDNGNKVCGTYVGGHRQEEKTETVVKCGKQI